MTERYTQLSVDKTRLYIPDSPVVLEAQALLKDNVTGEAIAQLKFKNISQESIKALTIGLKCFDVMGNAVEGVNNFQILDLNAQRDKTFGQTTPIPLPDKNTRSFEVINFSIVFQDGSIWVSEDEIEWIKLPGRISLASGLGSRDLASQYKRDIVGKTPKKLEETWSSITGTKIVHERIEPTTYPWEFEDLWCCTCGFDNHEDEANCHNCSLPKEKVFKTLDVGTLEKRTQEYKAKLEEERAAKEAEKKAKREQRRTWLNQHKKRLIAGIVSLVVVLGLVGAVSSIVSCSKESKTSTYKASSTGSKTQSKSSTSSSSSTQKDKSNDGIIKVNSIKSSLDLPSSLMNDKFKNTLSLLNKPFSKSGLSAANAVETEAGTSIFYLEGLEFLGKSCNRAEDKSKHGTARIIYETAGVKSGNGTPTKIYFSFSNPLKSNGHTETMEIVNGIAKALGLSTPVKVANDNTSSTTLATGLYCTYVFPNAGFKIEVTNTDGDVEIEILPM